MALCKYNPLRQELLHVLEEQPSDQVLMEVARKSLCSELELGIELKIKHHDIVNSLPIHENCSRGERKIELLLLWKRQKGCDATNRVLLSALNECGNRDKHLLEAVTCKMLIENGTEKCYVAFVSAMLLNEVYRPSFDVSLEMTPGRDIDILKSENVELKSENSALKSENNDLKNENKELKRRLKEQKDLRQHHNMDVKLHDDPKDGLMSIISRQEAPPDPYLPSHQSTNWAFDSSHQSFTTVVTYDASANLYLSPKSSYSSETSPIVISDTEEVDTVPELSPDNITDNPDESIDCSQNSVYSVDNSPPKTPALENPSLEDWPEGDVHCFLSVGSKRSFTDLDEDAQMGWVNSPQPQRKSYL